MAATRADIQEWLYIGLKKGASHVVVICDTYDWEDFPKYIMPGEDPRQHNHTSNMQKPMECYDLSLSIEQQLAEHRAQHWDMQETGAVAGSDGSRS